MRRILIVFSLFLASCCAYAQQGATSPSEDLAVGVFITGNLEELTAAHTPKAFDTLARIHAFRKGQTIGVVVILKGYKPRTKNFVLEGECELIAPDERSVLGKDPHCLTSFPQDSILHFLPPDIVYLSGGLGTARPEAPEGTNFVVVRISEVSPTPRFLVETTARFNLVHSSSSTQGIYTTAYRSQAELNAVFAAYTSAFAQASDAQGGSGSNAAATAYQPQAAYGGVGAKFGTRDPATCQSTREPTSGPISVEQAARYFMCSREEVGSGHITLVENLTLTVGNGRHASSAEWQLTSGMDPDSVVYPIRGSLTVYTCTIPNRSSYEFLNDVGRNCNTYEEPQAEGICYRTSFGDWRCSMTDAKHLQYNYRQKVPPPR